MREAVCRAALVFRATCACRCVHESVHRGVPRLVHLPSFKQRRCKTPAPWGSRKLQEPFLLQALLGRGRLLRKSLWPSAHAPSSPPFQLQALGKAARLLGP